jgi:hypothetical protein
MRDLFSMAALILAGLVLYGFRTRIGAALRRFDARNVARKQGEMRDRADRLAHYKHTLLLAEEQVEEIVALQVPDERTGQPVTRYLFEGEMFATREEADEVRKDEVLSKARAFYMELPAALAHRGKEKLN